MIDASKQFVSDPKSLSETMNYQFSGSKSEAAQMISDNLLQLRRVAQEAELGFLAYLLEMAFRESFMTSVNMNLGFSAQVTASNDDIDD